MPTCLAVTRFVSCRYSCPRRLPRLAPRASSCLADIGGDVLYTRANRRALLQRKFCFACSCPLCELSGDALAASDARQSRVFDITQTLTKLAATSGVRDWPHSTVPLIAERLRLMDEDGLPAVWGKTCCHLAVLWLKSAGRLKDAAAWAARGADCTRLALGTDSAECQRFHDLARDEEPRSAVGVKSRRRTR